MNFKHKKDELSERFISTEKFLFEEKDIISYIESKNSKLVEFQDAYSESIHIKYEIEIFYYEF
jgi:hypothetical protein